MSTPPDGVVVPSQPVRSRPGLAAWFAALICIVYGFAKLNGSQFTVLDSELTRPMGEVSGFWLTWYYFSYSPIYGTFIALVQICAGVMLVLPGLALVGALILLPLVINIVMIDLFYGVDVGGLVAAIVLLSCLLSILVPHIHRLRTALVQAGELHRPSVRRAIAIGAVLAGGWALTWWTANVNNRHPTPIDGTWSVTSGSADSSGVVERGVMFFEYNRAGMVVFREGPSHDTKHQFELDADRTVRIWQTWLKHDTLIAEGRWNGADEIRITFGSASIDTLQLTRRGVRR